MLKALAQMLDNAQKVLVVSHHDPDGDALGSSLAMMHILAGRGKEVFVHSAGPIPPEYLFLPGLDKITTELPPDGWCDAALLLDCHQRRRTGPAAAEYLAGVQNLAVIDHHKGEVNIGDPAWVEPSRAATSEMVAVLAKDAGWKISQDVAVCLFVGVQTDTGSFRYSNTTPATFALAGDLVAAGADPWSISQEVYATSLDRLKLWSRVVDGLDLMADGKLAVGQVTAEDFQATGCGPEDLENVVEGLRSIRGVEVALLLRQRAEGGVKISIRSRGSYDVSGVAIALGGGGHRNAAGALLPDGLEVSRPKVQAMLLDLMEAA